VAIVNFFNEFSPKRLFRSGIHSLLRRTDARWINDIIYIIDIASLRLEQSN